jgi:hypothetical protein
MKGTFIGNVVVDEERNIKLPEQLPLKPSQILEVFQEGDEVRLKLIDRKQLVEKLASLLREALKGISYEEIKAERKREDGLRQKKIEAWTEELEKTK